MIKIYKKRVEAVILEQILFYLLIIFGFAAIGLFATGIKQGVNYYNLAVFEILLIIIMAIITQTIIIVRIFQKRK